jgi:hypothetical protein
MLTYMVRPGDRISEAVKAIIQLANETGETVTAEFSRGEITAKPGDCLEEVIKKYEEGIGVTLDREFM